MIQPKLPDAHSFTRKEKSTIFIMMMVVAILFGGLFYCIGKKQIGSAIDDAEKMQLRKTADSCILLVSLRDSANAQLKRDYSLLQRKDVVTDSLFVNNYVKGKAELKYIANLDSAQRQARIDSILKGAKIRK